jgi:plasmid stability protein
MPAVTIRKLSVKTHQGLKKRAKKNGHSTEAEIRLILDDAAKPETARQPTRVGFGTALQQIFQKHGVSLPDIHRDKSPGQPAIFE